jgi:putative endonuclease
MSVAYFVYIARGRRGALRVGRTTDLAGSRHGTGGETSTRLVYVERFATAGDAILRERQLRGWRRRWKVELVESVNPRWDDLMGLVAA